jgi:DNA-binding response OmpR family regulator
LHKSLNKYRGKEKIIIADDDESLLRMLSNIFTEYGYNVITASNGQEAVDKFMQHRDVKLVILDFLMPKKDGVVPCKEITNIDPDIPIFLASGCLADSQDYSTKCQIFHRPFKPVDLIKKARAILDTHGNNCSH